MKILLINPPRYSEISANNPPIIEEQRGLNPPLGILYIAGYLEKYADHDIAVVDAQADGLSYPQLRSEIEKMSPGVVGITAMTLTLIDAIKTAKLVKEINSAIRVVLGGPHVYLFPDETIGLKDVDFLVLGEGEEAFKELLENIDDKSALRRIPGLVFRDKESIVNTGPRPLITDLDRIPPPARHLSPYKKYSSLLAKHKPVTTLFTSRGCPFKCSFCSRPHLGKAFRVQSAERVVDELEACVNMGIREFIFYDDTFTVNKQRVIDICNEIGRRGLRIAWDMRSRVDTVDDEMMRHLKRAGCYGIHYGVESGTDRILRILNKGITLEQVKRAFHMTQKYKILTLAYFMVGCPTETRDDIYETFRFMKTLNPDYAHITIFTPFPGSAVYLEGLRNGVIKEDYWRDFSKDPKADFAPPVWEEIFTGEELASLLIRGYKDFYIRPSYILKRLRSLRSFDELKNKIAAGWNVFIMR